MAAEWSQTLAAVERTYGVPKEVVLGVWGMETNFGSFTGSIYVVRALSTLAYTGYRGEFFGMSCSRRSRSSKRIISIAARCWAPGPAPWVRPS